MSISRKVSDTRARRHMMFPLLLYDLGEANHVLPPAAVLPEQFSHPTVPHTARGEVALMRAVLEDAVNCFQKKSLAAGRRAQRLAKEAEDWLFSDDTHWPFSFVNICMVLGIDPGYIRLGLKQWDQRLSLGPQRVRRRAMVARKPLKIAA